MSEPSTPNLNETVEGGRYETAQGIVVDANGEPIKGGGKQSNQQTEQQTEAAKSESQTAQKQQQNQTASKSVNQAPAKQQPAQNKNQKR